MGIKKASARTSEMVRRPCPRATIDSCSGFALNLAEQAPAELAFDRGDPRHDKSDNDDSTNCVPVSKPEQVQRWMDSWSHRQNSQGVGVDLGVSGLRITD